MLLGVTLNGQPIPDAALILRAPDGTFYASQRDLHAWRLLVPAGAAIQHLGETYVPLTGIAGLIWRFDERTQALVLQAPPQAFQGSTLTQGQQPGPLPARADAGGFVNYELFSQYTEGAGKPAISGLFEVGLFKGDYGVGVANFLAQNADNARRLVRLDTAWTLDDPKNRTSLRLGDSISRAAATWGRPVRFGGIQYATNFATQPYFSTFPLQSVSGQAVLPSTVDVFVNNALISSKPVPPGPFAIRDLPTITGGGDMRVVVRDVLGRDQVITQPFYASAALLAQGVEDFSYEAGSFRRNFGIDSNDYAGWLAAATYRRGVTSRFTAEVHAEAVRGDGGNQGTQITRSTQGTLGLAGSYLQPTWGVFNLAGAVSASQAGGGHLLGMSFERNVVGAISVNARSQWASAKFTQAGLAPEDAAPRQVSNASISYMTRHFGSVGAGYVMQQTHAGARTELLSVSYNVGLWGRATLGITALKTLSGAASNSIFAFVSFPLGERVNGSVSMRSDSSGGRRDNEAIAQVQKNLPAGEGHGWNVRAGSLGSYAAGVTYQGPYGTYSAETAHVRGQANATRATVAGGVAFIGGSAFAGRRINDSFGVVHLPDYPGTQIYTDNQPTTRVGTDGYAFLPRLRAYEKNRVGINQNDLPLDAKIDALTLEVTPYFRSGLVLTFPVTRASGGLVKIVLEDGKPLPAGATIHIEGQSAVFPVAQDGEAYLTALKEHNRLRVQWRGQSCPLELARPQSDDPLPHLGTLTCRGVRP